MLANYILYITLGLALGGFFSFLILKSIQSSLDKTIDQIEKDSKEKINNIEQDSKENIDYKKHTISSLDEQYTDVILPLESRVNKKQEFLNKRQSKVSSINEKISQFNTDLSSLNNKYKSVQSEAINQLSQKAEASLDQTLNSIKDGLEKEMSVYFAKEENSFLTHLSDIINKKAQESLKIVMQKYSEPSSTDKLDKFVELLSPKEALRIGGKNFENYAHISEVLGVDIEIDEYEANIVKVSGFILWKQEIAKSTLHKLSQLSHIDINIIDKVIDQSTKEMDSDLMKIGRQVAKDIKISQDDPEFMKILGRLQYRTSYGQNILFHSYEVGYFSQIIANLLGEDPRKAFLAGFFHDIGKAVDQEVEGTHDLLGKELLEKFGFDYEIYHPAHSHHYLVPVETTIGEIVIIADKISAGRPGARAESAEMYYERVQGLERIAHEQDGVKKAFAISAGREIRVYLDENKISDKKMPEIADHIAHQIEGELTYPGHIKVNLIRSIESVDYANKNK